MSCGAHPGGGGWRGRKAVSWLALDRDAVAAGLDAGADMAFGRALAEEGPADPHAADLNHIVMDDGLGLLAAQKAPANAHSGAVEIADIQHLLVEAIEQHKGAAVGTESAYLQGRSRLI